jgi:hypothetical protein
MDHPSLTLQARVFLGATVMQAVTVRQINPVLHGLWDMRAQDRFMAGSPGQSNQFQVVDMTM